MSEWRAEARLATKRLMSSTDDRDVEPRRREMSRASRERRSAVVSGRASMAERRCIVAGEEAVKEGRIEARSDMASQGALETC